MCFSQRPALSLTLSRKRERGRVPKRRGKIAVVSGRRFMGSGFYKLVCEYGYNGRMDLFPT